MSISSASVVTVPIDGVERCVRKPTSSSSFEMEWQKTIRPPGQKGYGFHVLSCLNICRYQDDNSDAIAGKGIPQRYGNMDFR